jgi:hypothetical protein
MSDEKKTAAQRLAEVEAREAERQAERDEAWSEQRILDLEACEAIQAQAPNVPHSKVDVVWSPGLVTLVMVRCPRKEELSRYRLGIKYNDGAMVPASVTDAAELLAAVTVVYPDRKGDEWKALCEARPAVSAGAGQAALKLSVATAQAEGKG